MIPGGHVEAGPGEKALTEGIRKETKGRKMNSIENSRKIRGSSRR